jgi:hypothetical protein
MTRSLLALILTVLLPNLTQAAMPPAASYLCYKAGLAPGQAKLPAAKTRLEDRFGSRTADVKSVQSVCNPTETAPHPAVHGVGYKIVGAKKPPQPPFAKTPVTTVDQFGSHRLVLVKPVDLLTPSALALGADGVAPGNTTGVDHFQCYKASRQKGAPKFVAPAPVVVTDVFGTLPVVLKKITKVCTPVDKDGGDPTAATHAWSLVCYQAGPAKGSEVAPATVSVNNSSFGPAVLVANKVAQVCVPAYLTTASDLCATPADCAATGSECVVGTCGGFPMKCGATFLDATHVLSEQAAGDCQQLVCDGAGGSASVPDPSDLPTSTSVCRVPACAGTPLAPSFIPAATGTDCSADGGLPGGVCGDTTSTAAGTCVECNTEAECPDRGDGSTPTCVAHACVYVPHGTQTFEFTGAPQEFVVPPAVTSVTIYAAGHMGGPGLLGGLGGSVTATIPVTPGESLAVYVGGMAFPDPTPGWNGGGWGGYGTSGNHGGGGGGASDVRQGGTALENRVVVGGGGGGLWAVYGNGSGGLGGGLVGGAGGGAPGWMGLGGTQTAGGAGGGTNPNCSGAPGTLGVGGDGSLHAGQPAFCSQYGGGGGGGGYYGGGGAGATGGESIGVYTGGGGGGSSYATPGASNVSYTTGTTERGTVVITW